MLDVPSATPTGRPVTAATEAAPRAIPNGSRTDTATGPAVSATRSVARPMAVARTKESQVGPSPPTPRDTRGVGGHGHPQRLLDRAVVLPCHGNHAEVHADAATPLTRRNA
ncbi:hypothetical protein [Streptomyces sp. NBC_00299]|uniref:hypothetical protein n=1 Tax=Streptomyces sp. NBC_00299 TaxID=2975705 RepID=UPI002E2C682B|nr:hypothetical protein [Streptomyces sp. NBC_00299]